MADRDDNPVPWRTDEDDDQPLRAPGIRVASGSRPVGREDGKRAAREALAVLRSKRAPESPMGSR